MSMKGARILMSVSITRMTAIMKVALFVKMRMVLFTANVLQASQFYPTDLVPT